MMSVQDTPEQRGEVTQADREAAAACARYFGHEFTGCEILSGEADMCSLVGILVSHRLAALSPPSEHREGEPVAWMYERNDGQYRFVEKQRWSEGDRATASRKGRLGYIETPLYAHPDSGQSALIEALGEALFALSAKLAEAPEFLANDANLAAYERVVHGFRALADLRRPS